jgi:hypothetical protein
MISLAADLSSARAGNATALENRDKQTAKAQDPDFIGAVLLQS